RDFPGVLGEQPPLLSSDVINGRNADGIIGHLPEEETGVTKAYGASGGRLSFQRSLCGRRRERWEGPADRYLVEGAGCGPRGLGITHLRVPLDAPLGPEFVIMTALDPGHAEIDRGLLHELVSLKLRTHVGHAARGGRSADGDGRKLP